MTTLRLFRLAAALGTAVVLTGCALFSSDDDVTLDDVPPGEIFQSIESSKSLKRSRVIRSMAAVEKGLMWFQMSPRAETSRVNLNAPPSITQASMASSSAP